MSTSKSWEKSLEGKTIASAEAIRAEYGRTYDTYLCLVFSDGSKKLLSGHGVCYSPRPTVEEMQKAPNFFSADDIADRVRQDELEKRARMKRLEDEERRQFEKLKERFCQ